MNVILLVIGAALLYKIFFQFIIPVYRVSRQLRKQFGNVYQQKDFRTAQSGIFNETREQFQQSKTSFRKSSAGDYIEFEEI